MGSPFGWQVRHLAERKATGVEATGSGFNVEAARPVLVVGLRGGLCFVLCFLFGGL